MSAPSVATVADPPAPEAVFARLAHLPHALWLDATSDATGTGRWSFIAADPFAVLQARGEHVSWVTAGGVETLPGTPVEEIAAALDRMRSGASPPIPFDGGAAGFIGYEAAAGFERLPAPLPTDHSLPDVHLAFYDVVAGWDRDTGACTIVSTGRPAEGHAAERRARARLEAALAWLSGTRLPVADLLASVPGVGAAPQAAPSSAGIPAHPVEDVPWLRSTVPRAEYLDAVGRIVTAIRDGEVYQVNLSQRFSARTRATPAEMHRELRRRSPAPYGAFVRVGRASILSSSPERFLHVEPDGRVEARPIKGTRPRHDDPTRDARLADELLESEKDRAENLMIVDLLRNDLSRVCRPGSIRVPALFRLESWATVHHLVSVVRGRLRRDVRLDDLLRATFPCGSVTGAPKIRAMELIAEHERVGRGPYCGAIGYFGFGGAVDLSVAIRILVAEDDRVSFHAGGGVVYDSSPEAEYAETLDKARGIIAALAATGAPAGAGAGALAPAR